MKSLETLPSSIVTQHRIDMDRTPEGPGRNFFILLDGTWNEERSADSSGALSNVRRLYDCLAADSAKQIARYFRGVGNAQDNGWLKRKLHGFNGAGERAIRKAVFASIHKDYRPGDRLFILGFSRGAACARRLASDLERFGLYPSIEIESECNANRITRQVETRVLSYTGKGGSIPVEISFLGCWDTVGAFVLPLRFPNHPKLNRCISWWTDFRQRWNGDEPFRNLQVASNVKRAVHCVAIDETRNAFLPMLMAPEEHIEEVWFPGVHADVGGGYQRDGLARITLDFMIARLDQHVDKNGLHPIEWDDNGLGEYRSIEDEQDYDFHYHGLSRGFRLNGKSLRRIRVRGADSSPQPIKPKLHVSVAELWQTDNAYAERKGKRWRVDYRPYNVTEINRIKDLMSLPESEWPFEWVES
ncbi:MAG: DUF2235 domain-containing protein [Opitutales bacterium]|nr:DUF2235 domain-containing protein [Opitutales bacterium]